MKSRCPVNGTARSEKLLNIYKVISASAFAFFVVCIAVGIFALGRTYGSKKAFNAVYANFVELEEKLSPEHKKCFEQIFVR